MPRSKVVGPAQPLSVDEFFAQYMNALALRSLIADFGTGSPEVRDYMAKNPRWRRDEGVFQEISRKARQLKGQHY